MLSQHSNSPEQNVEEGLRLRLLGGFSLRDSAGVIDLAPAGERVLALVALSGGSAHRSRIAGAMWPERPDDRATANLRSTMWRLPERVRLGLERHGTSVSFAGSWSVDIDICRSAAASPEDGSFAQAQLRTLLGLDLLPYWDCDWLPPLREQHRQFRLHALESLARQQLDAGVPLEAVDTVMGVIADSPLRESAQLLLLQAHLEAGNRPAVLREFDSFREMLRTELGLEPSAAMWQVVDLARAPEAPTRRTDDSVGSLTPGATPP